MIQLVIESTDFEVYMKEIISQCTEFFNEPFSPE